MPWTLIDGKSCAQRIGVEPVRRDAVRTLYVAVRAQRIDGIGSDDQQIAAGAPFDVRGLAIDGQRIVSARDERNAEVRHGDVLGTGELPPGATGRPQRRCELVRAVALDDGDARGRRENFQEIRDGRADDTPPPTITTS
jgi:hypothetical protein